jgi:hypothetical protein
MDAVKKGRTIRCVKGFHLRPCATFCNMVMIYGEEQFQHSTQPPSWRTAPCPVYPTGWKVVGWMHVCRIGSCVTMLVNAITNLWVS